MDDGGGRIYDETSTIISQIVGIVYNLADIFLSGGWVIPIW